VLPSTCPSPGACKPVPSVVTTEAWVPWLSCDPRPAAPPLQRWSQGAAAAAAAAAAAPPPPPPPAFGAKVHGRGIKSGTARPRQAPAPAPTTTTTQRPPGDRSAASSASAQSAASPSETPASPSAGPHPRSTSPRVHHGGHDGMPRLLIAARAGTASQPRTTAPRNPRQLSWSATARTVPCM